jgi:hypothetical protein|eukprot:SAG25_NODE_1078_length_4097_cov_12.124562_4_plen_71_part_00
MSPRTTGASNLPAPAVVISVLRASDDFFLAFPNVDQGQAPALRSQIFEVPPLEIGMRALVCNSFVVANRM